ncbi:MAG: hypothetical protein COV30_01415 [Candidatus Yanofskybacteria bacterium CG10_big_fil_rev_8_21_14_0_10_37_15]|uniref:Uncharacterized protein n=1 Tax=Candidatus Yanofskybacteria bacterium CG10_big_fil_rev_8_21_14_0_10_37_15 TaxID=1975097 RepID=A0A2H0R5N5_9BACT|nr:MAG: hypothetical protein COV30_01415 [Candidatus Yanofskybacteria bacterium CG10_big_fil_rev_8_21_14_0_10_37_15]
MNRKSGDSIDYYKKKRGSETTILGLVAILAVAFLFFIAYLIALFPSLSNGDTGEYSKDSAIATAIMAKKGGQISSSERFYKRRNKEEARQYGLAIDFYMAEECYEKIRGRLAEDKKFVSALKTARKAGVLVIPGYVFEIRNNFLLINVDASNEEIIEFLIGSKEAEKN